ncbi:hypothetical protein PVAND_007138 [Polypedilum vanderplanki]|uniref:Uncharacterized protein n=1 Tax=Polypedilum vanderplanki TaxID=319348 RepID=A0A9J6C6X6_POLVA|nr:hypothetical protein PVAND_007138 [Polypedilum vanderplanki]
MSGAVKIIEELASLEKRWSDLGISIRTNENFDNAAFNDLIKSTIELHLDFRIILFANQEIENLKGNIKIIISALQLKDHFNDLLNIALNTDKWDSNFGLTLLSGKLIGNASKFISFEKKLQIESDDVIRVRLDSLLHLLLNTNYDDDTGQIVLNVYESYRKMLLRDVRFQCKFSNEAFQKLAKNYLITLCHKKQFDHLSSAIKLFPNHRKLKFVCDLQTDEYVGPCHGHILEGFMEDLLQKEFKKDKSLQDIRNFNLYISKIIEIASLPNIAKHFNLEKLFLSVNTEVISEYYYLVATHLRIRMPNSYNNLVLKLVSIGLSHDISYLEILKYKDSGNFEMRDSMFKKTCCRIFQALVTLGYIIENYTVRRLCFEAAKVCEFDSNYCEKLLDRLPDCGDTNDTTDLDETLLDIRYQLEIFQNDIRSNINLPNTFAKNSNNIYETLTYFNHCVSLNDELKPLEYPGVEKYLKKQAFEDQDHISQTSDLDNCLREIDSYNLQLSDRLKKLQNFFKSYDLPLKKQHAPSNETIQNMCKEIFSNSAPDLFKNINDLGLFGEMFSIRLQDLLVESYDSYIKRHNAINSEKETNNLFFDFEYTNESLNNIDDEEIDSLYLSGTIPVKTLFDKGFGSYDVENILLYAIMEKKMKYIPAEFEFFNKNQNVEADANQNQVYAGLLYLLNKPHPEYARLMRLTSALMRFANCMEYMLDSYIMDATPGKFKYKLKHGKITKPKVEASSPPPSNEIEMNALISNTNCNQISTDTNTFEIGNNNSLRIAENLISEVEKQITDCNMSKTGKKPKPLPAITLNSNDTFNVSTEILNIFYNIKRELSLLTGKDVFLDLNKVSDITSSHTICSLQSTSSRISIKIVRTRNGRVDPREKSIEITMPLLVNGKLVLTNEIRDEIEYDEFFDNPKIKSTLIYRLSGVLTVESLSHNVKFDLDCRIDNIPSKIKFIFQGIRVSRPRKKPVQTSDKHYSSIENKSLSINNSAVINQLPTDTFLQQPNSKNANIATSSNNLMLITSINSDISSVSLDSQTKIFSSSQSCLPPFGTVSSSSYIPQIMPQFTNSLSNQYSTSSQPNLINNVTTIVDTTVNQTFVKDEPIYSSSSSININTQIQNMINYHSQILPQTNHQHKDEQQFIINDIHNIHTNPISKTHHVKSEKAKIISVEDVSPLRLSFSNPHIVAKEEINGFKIDKMTNQQVNNDLVDFEDAIQKSAVIPNKKNVPIEEIQSSQIKQLLLSPPPLHYPSSDITVLPKCEPMVIKQEQLTPTKELYTQKLESIQPKILSTNDKTKTKLKNPFVNYSNPTSIPLINNTHQLTSNVIMKKKSLHEMNGNKNAYDKFKVEEFIDLTDESIDDSKKNPDIQFVECESNPKTYSSSDHNRKSYKINASGRRVKTGIKRFLPQDEEKNTRECKVHILDAMKNINKEALKKETIIELKPYCSDKIYKNRVSKMHDHCEYEAEEVPVEEMPIENFADDPYDTVFTIVFQSSVSYLFIDDVIRGDGIANNVGTDKNNNTFNIASYNCKKTKITNDINEIVNKFTKLNNNANNSKKFESISIKKVENIIEKTIYSDKNHLNFTKNHKNRKKFSNWTPKVINCSNIVNDKKYAKSFFDNEKNHKSLLYQMSHKVLNSIPGMHSMEFFKMPSLLRRSLQIEVVHLKDIKANSSTTTNESSDINESTNNEPLVLHHNETNNGDMPKIHIQKIGQTSISHETEAKTLQTSFGSIVKNTYPPAISRVFTNEKDRLNKMKHDEGIIKKITIGESSFKTNQNVKIIACTSQQQQQELPKIVNKNQTLINMLSQQVMVPTSSNRHYIITSATKSSDIKQETGTSTSSQSNSCAMRKPITNAVGQSQLVQILNSPPSNLTMKSLNVITSSTNVNATVTKPIVSVSSTPAINTVEGLKAELPNSIKQQGIVQFICKTDGKIIHLTPICNNSTASGVTKKITYKVDTTGAKGPTILHHANQQIILNNQLRKDENPNILTIIQKQGDNTSSTTDKKIINKNTITGISSSQSNPTSPISTRSIYEENYAKFIQSPNPSSSSAVNPSDIGLLTISSSPINSSNSVNPNTFIQKIGKTVIQSSNQILPKFNQAFGKSLFSSSTLNEQAKSTKVTTNKETFTRSIVNSISPITKIATKSESKTTDGLLLNLIENDNIEKSITTSLPTLQSALQSNSLLYARPIGNGKLIASNNNNVLLTALRNSSHNTSNNVRIISSIPDSITANNHRTIMTPVRISVPIQIPQLINSVRPQSAGDFKSQIVIATTPTSTVPSLSGISTQVANTTLIRPQTSIQSHTVGSKLQSLLMGTQPSSTFTVSSTVISSNNHEIDNEIPKMQIKKIDQKPKKSVDSSTLEQLREFDMVLEQVRSSVTPNSVSSPPPRPESANHCSPRKQLHDNSRKMEIKSSSTSLASDSPNDSPTSSKSICSNSAKATTPKLQEDEHTAQRILDILANYKEQVRNSPDLNNKPAPRRRANPSTNPPAKRKKLAASSSSSNMKNSKQFGSSSDVMTDNTMGSEEDSSCGVGSGVASTGSMNNSPRGDIDDQTDASMDNNFYMEDAKKEIASSPQSSNSSIATSPARNKFSLTRKLLVSETKNSNNNNVNSLIDSCSSKSLIISSSQSSVSNASSITRTSSIGESIERLSAQGSTTTAVLMPGNYILPMNVLKSGQHLAILSSNNGQKIIAVPASQLASSSSTSGTSIILQRYVNQMNETGNNKTTLVQKTEIDETKNTLRLQKNITLNNNSTKNQHAFYVKPIDNRKQENKNESQEASSSSSSFVSDKTLITEIIQQQQQLSHNHPQHNFMIKLNETSDPLNSSSIMFMEDNVVDNKHFGTDNIKIKTEKMKFDDCIKEEIIDLNLSQDQFLDSPMLTTKMEVDENTNSNHDTGDIDNNSIQKLPKFPSILNSCLTKQTATNIVNADANESVETSNKHIAQGFLIDPSSKILMYNNRKQNNVVDKEIFNPKSFSEECADLGVDEPIASDLFPEADLLFDSDSPKFDQINPNDGAIQIKRELENGEVLLQMNYNHNISEPWLNCFDTEDELVDDSHGESGDDVKDSELLKNNHF